MAFPLVLKEYKVYDQLLKLYEPDINAIMDSYHQGFIPFPYWSQVWPAALALAGFLSHHPHYTRGKQVLELAAGLGLPALVAAGNAAFVIAGDYEPEAISVMQQTATLNGLQNMHIQLLDWYALPACLTADVLLLSDVSYNAALFEVQEKVIRQFLQQGTVVIISTPQRLVAKAAILPLLSFCNHQQEITVLHNKAAVPVTVMVLRQN